MSSFHLYTLKLWMHHIILTLSHLTTSLNLSRPSQHVWRHHQRPAQRRGTGSSVPSRSWWRRSCRRRDSGRAASRTTGSCCPITNSRGRAPVGDTALWCNTHTQPQTEILLKESFLWGGTVCSLRAGQRDLCSLHTLCHTVVVESQYSVMLLLFFSIIASQSDITCSPCKAFM